MSDLSIAFVYNPQNPYLCGKRYQVNMRKLFFDALPRVCDVTMLGHEHVFNCADIGREFDAWVFFDAVEWGAPKILNIEKLRGPKVCYIGDCHGAGKWSQAYERPKIDVCRLLGFDAYFFQHTPDYFCRFYPKDWTYWWIPMGVDAELYAEVEPHGMARHCHKVLLTGVLGEEYYPLRTASAKWPEVVHYEPPGSYSGWTNYAPGKWDGDRYKLLLEMWGAAIASGYSVVNKYFEIPAAGCVTFAHVDESNGCGIIGFEDGETAVLVDQENARARMGEYLATADDPKWARIAKAGRRFIMEHYTHDHTARMLIEKIKELC